MKLSAFSLVCMSSAFAVSAAAQKATQKAVPVASEPHHHLTYTSDRLRVFRVTVPAHTSTLLHQHDVDYFWVSVGAAKFSNVIPGKPAAAVVAVDGSVHFTRGGFAHIARVAGDSAFHNITLELPQKQTNPHNLCAPVIPGEKTNCASAMVHAVTLYTGATILPEFATDQTSVTLITIAPNAELTLAPVADRPILVSLDVALGLLPLKCTLNGKSMTTGLQAESGTISKISGAAPCVLSNPTSAPVRFLAVEFLAAR